MSGLIKQNGHPVTPNGIWFSDQEKPYTKEACDVRAHYSTLFSLSSNQNCQSDGYTRGHRSSHPGAARQALSTYLPSMRPEGFRFSQLDSAHSSGPEPCRCPT